MDADGQAERLGLLVDREEVGVVQGLVALDTTEEDAARAVLLAEAQLTDRSVDVAERGDDDVADAVFGLRPDVREEAVVGLAQLDLVGGVVGEVREEERGVDDLRVHVGGLHALEAHREVEQFARLPVGAVTHVLLHGGGDEEVAAPSGRTRVDLAVYEPHVVHAAVERVLRHLDNDGAPLVPVRVQKVPHLRWFCNVRVCVEYVSHPGPPRFLSDLWLTGRVCSPAA